MRICSLLPSITEILFELGLGDQIVGVTHECDWPTEARSRPQLTRSRIHGTGHSSAEIDRLVQEQPGSLYDLDAERLARLRPDIIFTQSLCPVCAVDETTVRRVAASLATEPPVVSFHPTSLGDVYRMIEAIGDAVGASAAAGRLNRLFHAEISQVRAKLDDRSARPRVIFLEWTDPPFAAGHWTPELVDVAGGRELLGRAGRPSRRATRDEIIAADPDLVVVAPCGFTLPRGLADVAELARRPEWSGLRAVRAGRVFVSDGSAYFNRPGPRLIASLQILAEVLHPDLFGGLAPPGSFQQVPAPERITQ